MHHVPHIFGWICFLLIEARDHLPEHFCLPQKLQLPGSQDMDGMVNKYGNLFKSGGFTDFTHHIVMETYGKATTQGMIKESFSYINDSLNPLFSCSSNPKCC